MRGLFARRAANSAHLAEMMRAVNVPQLAAFRAASSGPAPMMLWSDRRFEQRRMTTAATTSHQCGGLSWMVGGGGQFSATASDRRVSELWRMYGTSSSGGGSSGRPAPAGQASDERKAAAADGETKSDSAPAAAAADSTAVPEKKPGIIAQFKDLYKRYWYVMLPVHVVTSTGWMAAFYYLSASGVDVPELLRSIDVSDSIVSRFEQSKMGHLAIAYLCYKIATPVRYMVTIGGTTVSIKYLSQWGYIKPIPSNERLLEIYADKKAQMKAGYEEMQTKASDAISGPKGENDGKPK